LRLIISANYELSTAEKNTSRKRGKIQQHARFVCVECVYLICKLGKHTLLGRTALLLLLESSPAFVCACMHALCVRAAAAAVCAGQINNIRANKGFALMMKHATAALSN
jgi:hypothetical protein